MLLELSIHMKKKVFTSDAKDAELTALKREVMKLKCVLPFSSDSSKLDKSY